MKVTCQIDDEVVASIRQAVAEGAAPSMSALVEDAARAFILAHRQSRIRAGLAAAAADPMFRDDVAATVREWDGTLMDGLDS